VCRTGGCLGGGEDGECLNVTMGCLPQLNGMLIEVTASRKLHGMTGRGWLHDYGTFVYLPFERSMMRTGASWFQTCDILDDLG